MSDSNCIFNSYYLDKNIKEQSIKNILNIEEKFNVIRKWKKGIDEKSIYNFNY